MISAAVAHASKGVDDEALKKLPRAERVATLNAQSLEMTAVPVKGALVIDGRVSDAAWSRAVPVMSLYQRETFEGLPATEPTHVGSFRRHEPLYRRSGSDFFVVYNELDEWGQMFGVRNRSLSVKLNYLFAF